MTARIPIANGEWKNAVVWPHSDLCGPILIFPTATVSNRAVNWWYRRPARHAVRRAANESLPADAGSVCHVVDAASVQTGIFTSAARLNDRLEAHRWHVIPNST